MNQWAGLITAALFSVVAAAEPASSSQPLVIDVRTVDEYRQGHVRDAINIPYEQIGSQIAAVAPDRAAPLVLYCRSGRRSGIAEQTLRRMGYRQIENKGGLGDMQRSGYSIR
ncbi:MAG: rhodanese-like domain-containing protein [Synechococcaceae cyanobacterium SM1_2_3]|nr:rhodanese-like domain-containing protein [Synechococcaceae cyanobacterium SM1_2_3]